MSSQVLGESKVTHGFLTMWGKQVSASLTPTLFKGQLYCFLFLVSEPYKIVSYYFPLGNILYTYFVSKVPTCICSCSSDFLLLYISLLDILQFVHSMINRHLGCFQLFAIKILLQEHFFTCFLMHIYMFSRVNTWERNCWVRVCKYSNTSSTLIYKIVILILAALRINREP